MRPGSPLSVLAAVGVMLSLAGCSTGAGSALGYGQGDGNGATSSMPIKYGQHAVIGVSLDNRSERPIELLSLTPLQTANVTVSASYVAPLLRERDAKNLQGLVEVSVRDSSRPARVGAVVIRYRQDGRILTETTGEAACFFPPHRDSACALPH